MYYVVRCSEIEINKIETGKFSDTPSSFAQIQEAIKELKAEIDILKQK